MNAQTEVDTLTILTHTTGRLCKQWMVDGTISAYDETKNYKVRAVRVDDMRGLSAALTQLEGERGSAVIRGVPNAYVDPEAAPGRRRKIKAAYDDVPHHWMLVEVDDFVPFNGDPVHDPEVCIDEFIQAKMPPEFAGTSYHWQLSNSAGSARAAGKLKAHVWFWLAEARTSEDLKTWSLGLGLEIDNSVLNSVQFHYTAAPVAEPGVLIPVLRRSGFVEGLMGDEVAVDITARVASSGGALTVLDDNDAWLMGVVLNEGWSLAEARAVLFGCDPNCDRDHWLKALMALHHETAGSDSGLALADEWSAGGASYGGLDDVTGRWNSFGKGSGTITGKWLLKWSEECAVKGRYKAADDWRDAINSASAEFDLREKVCPRIAGDDRLGDIERESLARVLHAAFARLERKQPIAACRKLIEQPTQADAAPAATHASYARAFLDVLRKRHGGAEPVGVEGRIHVPDANAIWGPIEQVNTEVSNLFDGLECCERRSDYVAIGQHAYEIAARDGEGFFDEAPVGLACGGVFYRIDADGAAVSEPLTPLHRQRFEAPHAPVAGPMPLFTKYLQRTFKHDDKTETQEQIGLVQEVTGATLFGLMAKHEKVALLKGPSRSGKSTFQRVIESGVNKRYTAATSPFLWDREYYVANLAGKRLNLVGELPDGTPIPSSYFKTVIGRDTLTGRHPSGRPFTFRNEAAHIFNSNHYVYTTDRSDAFFTRWLLIEFNNSLLGNDSEIDEDLAASIVLTEMPAIIEWAMQGAQRLQRRGHFQITRAHRRMMDKWRVRTDPVMEFLSDPEACILASEASAPRPDGFKVKRTVLYAAYEHWCRESNRKPLGKMKFNDEIESPVVASLGVIVKRDSVSREVVHGVDVWHPWGRPDAEPAIGADLFA